MRPGFTLIEIVLVLGIMGMLLLFTIPSGLESVRQQVFVNAQSSLRQAIASAREDASAGTGAAAAGVAIFPQQVVRFRGSSYAGRNTAYDVITPLNALITLTGTPEVTFTRPDGFPNVSATFVLSDGRRSTTTTVNALGTIEVTGAVR